MTTVNIPEHLERRLADIAKARHISVESLTTGVLEEYVQEEECYNSEQAEDESRWQRYVWTGNSISRENMSRKLRNLAQRSRYEFRSKR